MNNVHCCITKLLSNLRPWAWLPHAPCTLVQVTNLVKPSHCWQCRWDNNPPYDLSLEPSFRAKMCYQNRLKSSLSSIKQSLEIILRGTKHRVSEVPQMSSQLFHKILLIHMIPTV